MSLQDIFYLFSIIFMALGIILLIVIGYVLFVIKNNITHLHDLIDTKIQAFSRYTEDPSEAAFALGSKVMSTAFKKVKNIFNK